MEVFLAVPEPPTHVRYLKPPAIRARCLAIRESNAWPEQFSEAELRFRPSHDGQHEKENTHSKPLLLWTGTSRPLRDVPLPTSALSRGKMAPMSCCNIPEIGSNPQ
jgi:hypothetical protein